MKSNISLVIPIGKFSYFVNANLQNVFESIDPESDLDFVFVTSALVEPKVEEAIKKAQSEGKYKFRRLRVNFNAGGNHLRLLDWAIKHNSMRDWVLTHHCDVFWRTHGWLEKIQTAISENEDSAFVAQRNYQFKHGDELISLLGDYFGVYNRQKFLDEGYSFQWGYNTEKSPLFDPKTKELIDLGFITRTNGSFLKDGEFIDGSVAMSLRAAINKPESIKLIDLQKDMVHLLAFFRIEDSISFKDNVMRINLPFKANYGGCSNDLWIDAFARYSFMTSFIFDKEEARKPLPWCLMEKISSEAMISLSGGSEMGEWLRKYSQVDESQTLGMNDLGIKKIKFTNCEFNF